MDIFKQLGDSPIRGMCLGIFVLLSCFMFGWGFLVFVWFSLVVFFVVRG